MKNQTIVLETETLLNSISKKGAILLNMFNEEYKKALTNILILESLNIPNKAVLVFSLSRREEDLIDNLLCTIAGVHPDKKNLKDSDWEKLADAMNEFRDTSIYISDECKTLDTIILTLSDFIKSNRAELNFVLIDSLEKIESDKGFDVILEELNTFARNNNLSLIILK